MLTLWWLLTPMRTAWVWLARIMKENGYLSMVTKPAWFSFTTSLRTALPWAKWRVTNMWWRLLWLPSSSKRLPTRTTWRCMMNTLDLSGLHVWFVFLKVRKLILVVVKKATASWDKTSFVTRMLFQLAAFWLKSALGQKTKVRPSSTCSWTSTWNTDLLSTIPSMWWSLARVVQTKSRPWWMVSVQILLRN